MCKRKRGSQKSNHTKFSFGGKKNDFQQKKGMNYKVKLGFRGKGGQSSGSRARAKGRGVLSKAFKVCGSSMGGKRGGSKKRRGGKLTKLEESLEE